MQPWETSTIRPETMSKGAFPRAATLYILANIDEWPSVLAYRIGVLFGYPCTKRGVQNKIIQLRRGQDAMQTKGLVKTEEDISIG